MEQGKETPWQQRPLLGDGLSGEVRAVAVGEGLWLAEKRFFADGVCVESLRRGLRQLQARPWPEGVLPVLAATWSEQGCGWTMPLIGELDGHGGFTPAHLQQRLAEFPGESSWPVIRGLARALAGLHAAGVVHGNLKPGNVFLSPEGDVLLADWAMGARVERLAHGFTDALLYQPPEQLRQPGGYGDGLARSWDVFAFGVMAFRLLTGRFPRCDAMFRKVAPAPGMTRVEGIRADLEKIARALEADDEVRWPEPPADAREEGCRRWIDACLELRPSARPADLGTVAAGLESVERETRHSAERESLLDQRRAALRGKRHAAVVAGVFAVGAAIMAFFWQQGIGDADLAAGRSAKELREDRQARQRAEAAREAAEEQAAASAAALEAGRERWLSRLHESRRLNDRLFSWSLETGRRQIPPLDGRELRLRQLEQGILRFLEDTEGLPEFEEEHAQARLQLAEISLAAGEVESAGKRLAAVRELLWKGRLEDFHALRIAENSLWLAILQVEQESPAAEPSLLAARAELEAVPQAGADADRLAHCLAVLDVQEARLLAARGEEAGALERLLRATRELNRLATQRPESAVLRSELAACYLTSAGLLDGMGKVGDAREIRTLAASQWLRLLRENPGDSAIRLHLAECYAGMAEASLLSADLSGCETTAREAMKLLEALIVEQPDHREALSRRAALLGLLAGIERDRGQTEQAMADYEEGIRILENLHAADPQEPMSAYRLAVLWWQKGRMLGNAGEREQETGLLGRAREIFERLAASPSPEGPRPEGLRAGTAYLLGDLGHSRQLAGDPAAARAAFEAACELWRSLLKGRPRHEEYEESLAWCLRRIQDLP